MKVRTQQYSEGLRKMKCNSAMIVNHFNKPYLALEIPEREMIDWLMHYETRMPMDIEIRQKKKKRSLDANAYCWVLCDKIASAVGTTKEEVYKSHIRDVGVFTDICLTEEACEYYLSMWSEKGIGWFAEELPNCKIPKCRKIRAYYGSSVYDTKQMARLIDNLIYEAKQIGGIETLPPDELERMKAAWNTK